MEVGLFEHIDNPLWKDRYEAMDLDIELITRFGEKPISPFLKYFLKDGEIDEASAKKMMNLIYRKFKDSWERKYAVLDVQYQIIDNYNMTETEQLDRDVIENNIRDILRTNKEAATQINDLMETIDAMNKNINQKSGADTTKGTVSNNETGTTKGSETNKVDKTATDTLSFIDRKDASQEIVESDARGTSKVDDAKSDELSFIGRRDSTTDQTETKLDESVSNANEVDNTSTKNSEDKESTYGFDSTSAVPSNERDGLETVTDARLEKGSASTLSTNKVNGEVKTVKDGREINTITGSTNTDSTEKTTVDKTNNLTKTGSERNNISEDTTTTGQSEVTNSSELSGSTNDTITYNSKVEDNGEANTSKSNTGKVTNNSNTDETESGSINNTVDHKELRSLTRSGNIGVTTTTDLLQQHIEFWNYSFLEDVYRDILSMISLKIY